MTKRSKAPARALALLALVGGFVVVIVVVSAALSGESSDDGGDRGSGSAARTAPKPAPRKKAPKTYVIENGDTLTAIARKTGVPVVKIERLNPDVDPQILISGEKLKLR